MPKKRSRAASNEVTTTTEEEAAGAAVGAVVRGVPAAAVAVEREAVEDVVPLPAPPLPPADLLRLPSESISGLLSSP